MSRVLTTARRHPTPGCRRILCQAILSQKYVDSYNTSRGAFEMERISGIHRPFLEIASSRFSFSDETNTDKLK